MELAGIVSLAVAGAAVLFEAGIWFRVARGHRRWQRIVAHEVVGPEWPRVHVMVCLKGSLPHLGDTVRALEAQDYPGGFRLTFVTEAAADQGDPAAQALRPLLAETRLSDHVVAGHVLESGVRCAQKNHNLLVGLGRAEAKHGPAEIYAFCDGDLVVKPEWLREMVRPIALGTGEASTSFHGISARTGHLTETLHALAEASQSLAVLVVRGTTWGGSMAIRAETFRRHGLADLWRRAVVDDIAMSQVLRAARLRVIPVPRFLVSSPSVIPNARSLVQWVGRQFFFVKVYLPSRYRLLFAKFCLSSAVLGLAAFHGIWRLVDGSWPAGGVAGGAVLIAAGIGLASTAFSQLLHPGPIPWRAGLPATLLLPGLGLLGCANASLRRQRLTWGDLTYELDGEGRVAEVVPVADIETARSA